MTSFTYTLELLSDWHIGSGGGRHGSVDRLLDRDAQDLPYVPGSSVRGILRDAAERLALGLDDGDAKGDWAKFVKQLFGSQPGQNDKDDKTRPVPGCLMLEDARLPEALRNAISKRKDRRLREALTFVKPGVKIDPDTGRALDDFLRFEEMGRAGTVLVGAGSLQLPDGISDEDADVAKAFLLAAAMLVERIGGKRRRGAGRCRLRIAFEGMEAETAIARLKDAGPPEWEIEKTNGSHVFADGAGGGAWREFTFVAEVETPLIIPDRIMGNVATTLDHVPGTFLLKFVVDRLTQAGLDDPWPHIFTGDIQVLPLYPARQDKNKGKHKRALPAPLCLEKPKMGDAPVRNACLRNDKGDESRKDDGKGADNGTVKYQALKRGYVWLSNDRVHYLASVPQVLRTHNTVQDEKQRPTSEVGGVYSYEAIAPGIALAGMVRIREEVLNRLKQTPDFTGTARVGRAMRMGYGRLRITAGGEAQPPQPSEPQNGLLWLWLTTDMLLPGEALGGATHLDALIDALEEKLGRERGSLFDRKNSCAFLRPRRLESWQMSWGMPRPSLVGIRAGSVVCLPLKEGQNLTANDLRKLQDGIGERLGEGFGQVLVNPPLLIEEKVELKEVKDEDLKVSNAEAANIPDEYKDFAELIEQTAFRRAIAEAVEAIAGDDAKRTEVLAWADDRPVSSQLGVLRTLVSNAVDVAELGEALRAWIKGVRDKDKASKWGDKALKELEGLIDEQGNSRIWEILEKAQKTAWPRLLASEEDLKRQFELEALKTFLLRAIHYHRRMLERAQESDNADDSKQTEHAP